jgi:predicted metal-binding membrane protein
VRAKACSCAGRAAEHECCLAEARERSYDLGGLAGGDVGVSSAHPDQSAGRWPVRTLQLSAVLIVAILCGLSLIAWILTARTSGGMQVGTTSLINPAAAGMEQAMPAMPAPLFLAMWVTMMVAMMFPAAAPIVVIQWRLSRLRGQGAWAVVLFVAGYLFTWTVTGLAALAIYQVSVAVIPALSRQAAMLLTAAIFLLVGLYQLSWFKSVCLGHCRSPFDFFAHWRRGLRGAARMGMGHGFYCVGCCWALMLIFLTVGLANLAWMGIIATAIFVEKIAPFGRRMAQTTGVASLVVALAFALVPALQAGLPYGG